MKNKVKRYLKIFFSILLIWIVLLLLINFRSIIDLGHFLIGKSNYVYKSNDPVAKDSDYKILYELVNLNKDLTIIPPLYFSSEPNYNKKLPSNGKINYFRMLFILKCLDSLEINYDTIWIQDKYSRAPEYSCDIFIKPNKNNDFTLITAHYDNLKIPDYQGALDNSAAVAILINTIRSCKEILHDKNVAFLFTTLEEQGFMGAQEFLTYSKEHNFKINKVICLDGLGRGNLSAMNNCLGSFGFKFRDYFFREKLFTGYSLKNCPRYLKVDNSIIDLKKYKINVLHSFLSSTDSRVFIIDGIPTIHLTSSDIPHFLKVLHTTRDRIDGLQYKSIKNSQDILCDIIRNLN
jgi:hypothetical protein